MNILIIAKKIPYPLEDGASIRLFHILKYLSEDHDITLIAISRDARDAILLENISSFCRSIILIDESPGIFKKGANILLSLIKRLPYTVLANTSRALKTVISEVLESSKIDFIQIEELYMANNVPASEFFRVVLSTYNIEHLILERLASSASFPRKKFLKFQADMMKIFEDRIAAESRQIITVSEVDQSYYQTVNPRTIVVSNGVEDISSTKVPRRNQLMLTGLLSYRPNFEAVLYFLRSVMPLIADLNLDVIVVARNPPLELTRYSSDKVKFLANESCVELHFRSSFALCVPLLAGAGTKLKILQAFANYLPVVTTAVGAEGLNIVDGCNALVADTPEEFAEKIRLLKDSEDLQNLLTRNAVELVRERHLWKDCVVEMLNFYKQ